MNTEEGCGKDVPWERVQGLPNAPHHSYHWEKHPWLKAPCGLMEQEGPGCRPLHPTAPHFCLVGFFSVEIGFEE